MRQNPHVRICGGPGSETTLVYPTAGQHHHLSDRIFVSDVLPSGELSRPTGFLPADAIRRWSAEGGHPIQDLTAQDDLTPLPSWTPGAKAISDDGLVAGSRGNVSGAAGPHRGSAHPPPAAPHQNSSSWR